MLTIVSVTIGVGVHAWGRCVAGALAKYRRPSLEALRRPALLSIGVAEGIR